MTTRHRIIDIPVDGQHIAGTLVAPATLVPGVLLVHGWDGSQEQYLARSHEIAALGCICLTFDLRGHARHEGQRDTITPEANLKDLVAAYDVLVGHPAVDHSAMAIIGSSYGAYLAAILTSVRPVRWLALRVPALYKDEHWTRAKRKLDKQELADYRLKIVDPQHNRALRACAVFGGDALVVESQHDHIVPHPTVESYLAALKNAHSLTYRVIEGADHSLSDQATRQAYTVLLVNWMTEMVQGAREGNSAGGTLAVHSKSVQRTPSRG